MKFICEHAERGLCEKTDCRHYHSHEDGPDCQLTYECGETVRCVMDVAALAVVPKEGMVAIMISRRERT